MAITPAKGFMNAMYTVAGWHENQPLQRMVILTLNGVTLAVLLQNAMYTVAGWHENQPLLPPL